MPPKAKANPAPGAGKEMGSTEMSPSWKLLICPEEPLHEVPFLLTSSPLASLFSLRKRIATILEKHSEEGLLKSEQILLFINFNGIDCALLEDGPIGEVLGEGEKIKIRLDHAPPKTKNTKQSRTEAEEAKFGSTSLGKRQIDDTDEDILLEANRIAQKIKTEIGTNDSKTYSAPVEPEWPAPPPGLPGLSTSVTNPLPLLPMSNSSPGNAAAAAMKAFEEQKQQKRKLEMATQAKEASKGATSSSSSSSSSDSSSDSDSDSEESESDSSSSSEDDSSSSSSSSDSSSEDSSSGSSSASSSSDSDSSSDTDSEDDQASSHQTSITTAPPQAWVPPGKGLPRTQRKNQSRRERRKEAEQEEREQRFQEAKCRAEKRQKGEEVDEEAAGKAWTIDTKGSKTNGGHLPLQHQKVTVVARDAGLVLPPGGGSFGLPVKAKVGGVKTRASQILPGQSSNKTERQAEQVQEEHNDANETVSVMGTGSRQAPPPSLRNTKIPEGVRLTSVDCDDWYYNSHLADNFEEGWVDEEDEVSEAYAAFQAKAKEALRIARERDEEDDVDMVEPVEKDTFADAGAVWEDAEAESDVHSEGQESEVGATFTAHHRADDEGAGWVDEEATELDAARAMFPDLPMAFGKKDDWDGNEPLVRQQQTVKNGTQGVVERGGAANAQEEAELDYGDPEDAQFRPAGVHRDIEILRHILDEERAKRSGGKAGGGNGVIDDSLKKAREAALATLRAGKPS